MTAPTEAEIREAIERKWDAPGAGIGDEMSDAFGPAITAADSLYATHDFRPSEQAALDRITGDAIEPIRARAIPECKEAIIAAAIQFAQEHPDAPRAVPEPVTA